MDLRDLRKRSGRSVAAISKDIGITTNTWYRWEGGTFNPDLAMAHKIAMSINTSLEELVAAVKPPVKYDKVVDERYIRMTLLVEARTYKMMLAYMDFIKDMGTPLSDKVPPRQPGKALDYLLGEAQATYSFYLEDEDDLEMTGDMAA